MSAPASEGPVEGQLEGVVGRVLFENRESGWTIFHLQPETGARVTIVGPLARVFPGESLQVSGRWESDPKYGRQFRASVARSVVPESEAGTRRYLASGVVPGIGPELARRLVERFGADTLRVLDEEPDRLLEVKGIGRKRLAEIKKAWVTRSAERQGRIFLQGHGLGPALTERILRAWGEDAIRRVRREPYDLVAEVRGIGFRTADGLALRMGIAVDAPERIRAGILHVLRVAADGGDCYVPREQLVRGAQRALELDQPGLVEKSIAALAGGPALVIEGDDPEGRSRVYLRRLHAAERRVARRLAGLVAATEESPDAERTSRALRQVESRLEVDLASAQQDAVLRALVGRVLVVTGGPGTGKTTLIDALVRCARMLGQRVALAAPTGRAAKRMEQATGHPASTLHRLLEYRYDTGFGRGSDNPIEADLLVVDEMSMVDLPLMDAFLAAVPTGARLLLVGDADQLPPVGPGAVLRDLIASERLPTVRLREIYRQAGESLIVTNAHRVNAGKMPISAPGGESVRGRESGDGGGKEDFYIIEQQDAERARSIVLRLVTERIPQRFGLDPMRDIQVLTPMHRGSAGVANLNAVLQDALNPGAKAAKPDAPILRPGDRVMQLRNDYDREVFNGDIGSVVATEEEAVSVEFDGRLVGYDRSSLRDLTLAYAISIHKSQGSEYPAVVVVLLPEHRIMLQRNLLYTALTRAKKVAVLVTTSQALRRAVENAAPSSRFTTLAERIGSALQG